jgi:hypothetical protein
MEVGHVNKEMENLFFLTNNLNLFYPIIYIQLSFINCFINQFVFIYLLLAILGLELSLMLARQTLYHLSHSVNPPMCF